MRFAIQLCGYGVGLPLELLIIAALLRGGYRRFPFIFAYIIVEFLTTVLEIPAYVAYYTGHPFATGHGRAYYYWLDEGVLQALIFAVVISLVYHATAKLGSRRIVRASLVGGAILFAGASFLIHFQHGVVAGTWMTPWTRDLSFSSTILDLALWAMLIASREKDHRLLMLSGALGIQFTGEAIGESLRHLSRSTVFPGNVLIMLTNLLFLYIWWQALRTAPARQPSGVTL